jgi:imidazole glycerol-phosphate synthase subunit HisH
MAARNLRASPDWVGGMVRKLPAAGVRVPHVGWNTVRFEHAWSGIPLGYTADYYFDHSYAYHVPGSGKSIGMCRHGEEFSAIIQRDNVIAVQFHPEKSQTAGLRLIEAFLSQ